VNRAVRKILEDGGYRVVVRKIQGGFKLVLPDGGELAWYTQYYGGPEGSYDVGTPGGKEFLGVPDYALPTAVELIVEAACQAVDPPYDSAYAFFRDEAGEEVEDAEGLFPKLEPDRRLKADKLSHLFRNCRDLTEEDLERLAIEFDVVEGFESCLTIAKEI